MKPFDIQKALEGAPVVTRDGKQVCGLSNRYTGRAYPLSAIIDGDEYTWTEAGVQFLGVEGEYDLFMADIQPPDYAIPAEATGIEAELCRMFTERQAFGIKKYGVTVEDNPLSLREWLNHALMESMDHCVYLLRAIKELDKKEGK